MRQIASRLDFYWGFFMYCPVYCLLANPVWQYDHLFEGEGAGCIAGLFAVCHILFALPLGAIGRPCSVIVALP